MHLKELKKKTPAELVQMAEELDVEGASTLRRQDLMFAILKEVAEDGEEILGIGTIEVRRPWQLVTIVVDSDSFTNRWVDLDYSLVNRQTQQSIDAYGIVEFYTGTDSDGPWSEGSHHAETLISQVPRGTYDVYVDAGAHGWPSDPTPGSIDPANPWGQGETVALWFNSCTGGFSWGMFWLMAALLFSVPGVIFWWRHDS